MRVIGTGAELQRQARRRLIRSGVFFSVSLILLITWSLLHFASTDSVLTTSVLGLGCILSSAWGMGSYRRGMTTISTPKACRAVLRTLANSLGDEYVMLRQVHLPPNGALADVILLGPHGALVLSLQALRGTYLQHEHRWYKLAPDGTAHVWERSPTWDLTRPWKSTFRLVREYAATGLPVSAAVVLASGSLAPEEMERMTSPGKRGPSAAKRAIALGNAESVTQRSRFLRPSVQENHPIFPVITSMEIVELVKTLPVTEKATPQMISELADMFRPYVG